ncbi:MAG: carboxypeptidase regulatory-like domain-containing protein [Pseudobacteriovorax sp.]|nr:carboxypeptidase regulatory-like domain-containing protein [Pseudobacteriovorax sp.]
MMNLKLLKLLGLTVLLSACLDSADDSLSPKAVDFMIKGRSVDQTGAGIENVDIYLNDAVAISARSEESGQFEVQITASDLGISLTDEPPSIKLYYQAGDSSSFGVSDSIQVAWGTTFDLGDEVLTFPVDFSGSITLFDGVSLIPANGADISLGRETATSSEDGSYGFEQIPSGTLDLTASFPGYLPFETTINTNQLLNGSQTGNITLFRESLAGVLISGSLNSGNLQEFLCRFGSDVAFYKVATDLDFVGQSGELPSEWIAIQDAIVVDISGATKVFYQFANQEQDEVSPIYSIDLIDGTLSSQP